MERDRQRQRTHRAIGHRETEKNSREIDKKRETDIQTKTETDRGR